jgi:hypothetical protein
MAGPKLKNYRASGLVPRRTAAVQSPRINGHVRPVPDGRPHISICREAAVDEAAAQHVLRGTGLVSATIAEVLEIHYLGSSSVLDNLNLYLRDRALLALPAPGPVD